MLKGTTLRGVHPDGRIRALTCCAPTARSFRPEVNTELLRRHADLIITQLGPPASSSISATRHAVMNFCHVVLDWRDLGGTEPMDFAGKSAAHHRSADAGACVVFVFDSRRETVSGAWDAYT